MTNILIVVNGGNITKRRNYAAKKHGIETRCAKDDVSVDSRDPLREKDSDWEMRTGVKTRGLLLLILNPNHEVHTQISFESANYKIKLEKSPCDSRDSV